MTDIFAYLRNNSYPGRGMIIGSCNNEPVISYFIMGRSANSRNRIFVKNNDILYTKAYDELLVSDPSLIIYNAVREYQGNIIVTNGNQTDTIYEYLAAGETFRQALETREYEPDEPNFTPRISAVIHDDLSYDISILKKQGDFCQRLFYSYQAKEKTAHFISTYEHDGNPLPSFSSEPLELKVDHTFEEFTAELWQSLDEDNRISLYVRFGNQETIINRNRSKQ